MKKLLFILLLFPFFLHAQYSYGVNNGYYGSKWSTPQLIDLAVKAGAKSFRHPIYDDYLTGYGLTSEISDIKKMIAGGAVEITAFIGSPSAAHRDTTTFAGSPERSKVFKGLYDPIWDSIGKVNPTNTFAKYVYDVVTTYGSYIKYVEIVNEPDFTYSSAGWLGDAEPPAKGSWFDHNPTPSELVNLRAPIFYYIRMLRVASEVIHKTNPNLLVCTGGISARGFLDAVLRNTDNPVDGSVSSDYPSKGGAYFDVLSFHDYPEYQLRVWNNTKGNFDYFRYSDAAVNLGLLKVKGWLDDILAKYGFKKPSICTETGVSRIMSGSDWGSMEGGKNYAIKASIIAQKKDISQIYWYQLGDASKTGTNQFDFMGHYLYFGDTTAAVKSAQGIALSTTSQFLFGKAYDSAKTVSLNLPAGIDGAAFKNGDNYVYVLWAKTTTDMSESASAVYSFQDNSFNDVIRREWDYSQSGLQIQQPKSYINLTATPSFFEPIPKKILTTIKVYADGTIDKQ